MSVWRRRCGDIARACTPCQYDQKPPSERPESQHEPHVPYPHHQQAYGQQQYQMQQPYQQTYMQQAYPDPQRQGNYLQPPPPSFQTGNTIGTGGLHVGDELRLVGKSYYADDDVKPVVPEYDQSESGGRGLGVASGNKIAMDVPHASVVAIDAWQARKGIEPDKDGPPKVSDGFKEAMTAPTSVSVPVVEEENEPEPEEQKAEVDAGRETFKARAVLALTFLAWILIFVIIALAKTGYDEEVCTDEMKDTADVCEVCGSGTLLLPLYGDFERSWPRVIKIFLYFIGLVWCFLGIAIVCDSFMAAIEEITSQRRVVWLEVHGGAKQKFPVPVWNATVANLTLMALGSSAPEILLSIIELLGNNNFAGELGPSTIVGSAAFNLLVITAVCVSALPDKETKKIEMTGVFAVTAFFSIFAYVWLLVILKFISPDKVQPWEAVVTLLFCPVLVFLAFFADKGWILTWVSHFTPELNMAQIADEKLKLEAKYGKSISVDMARIILQSEMQAAMVQANQLQAARRKDVMSLFTGTNKKKRDTQDLVFGFRESKVVCLECVGTLKVPVVCSWAPGVPCQVRYKTRDGTAHAGTRYEHVEGILPIDPDKAEAFIEVPIHDNDEYEDEAATFAIELTDLAVTGVPRPCPDRIGLLSGLKGLLGKKADLDVRYRLQCAVATVSILNDDLPGMLNWSADEVKAMRETDVTLSINRTEGTTGEISCTYETEDITAKSGRDYTGSSGIVTFGEGEQFQEIKIPILSCGKSDRSFQVVLSKASHGVKFDPDGAEVSASCEVIIEGEEAGSCWSRLMKGVFNPTKMHRSYEEWMEQIVAAVYCNGSADEQAEASCQDWFFHVVSLPWKLLFSLIPPPSLLAGWLCFAVALSLIGFVTAVVGDMAGLLGCSLGLPNDITAITLVALGTSLPDTFASKTAAQQDETADNSVGNITGSNSVNVFLGLGLPWTLAAFYWNEQGVTDLWRQHKVPCKGTCQTYEVRFLDDYPDGGFMVPADSLGSSVAVFSICAILCITMLLWRRGKYGGELGGPRMAAVRDGLFAVFLWGVYVLISIIISLA